MMFYYKIGNGALVRDTSMHTSYGANGSYTVEVEDWVGLEQYRDYNFGVGTNINRIYLTFDLSFWNTARTISATEYFDMADKRMQEIDKEISSQGYSDYNISLNPARVAKINYWHNLYSTQSFHNGIVSANAPQGINPVPLTNSITNAKPSLPPQIVALTSYGLAHGNCSDEPRSGTAKYAPPDCECGLDKAGCGGDHSSWCAKGIFLKGTNV